MTEGYQDFIRKDRINIESVCRVDGHFIISIGVMILTEVEVIQTCRYKKTGIPVEGHETIDGMTINIGHDMTKEKIKWVDRN